MPVTREDFDKGLKNLQAAILDAIGKTPSSSSDAANTRHTIANGQLEKVRKTLEPLLDHIDPPIFNGIMAACATLLGESIKDSKALEFDIGKVIKFTLAMHTAAEDITKIMDTVAKQPEAPEDATIKAALVKIELLKALEAAFGKNTDVTDKVIRREVTKDDLTQVASASENLRNFLTSEAAIRNSFAEKLTGFLHRFGTKILPDAGYSIKENFTKIATAIIEGLKDFKRGFTNNMEGMRNNNASIKIGYVFGCVVNGLIKTFLVVALPVLISAKAIAALTKTSIAATRVFGPAVVGGFEAGFRYVGSAMSGKDFSGPLSNILPNGVLRTITGTLSAFGVSKATTATPGIPISEAIVDSKEKSGKGSGNLDVP